MAEASDAPEGAALDSTVERLFRVLRKLESIVVGDTLTAEEELLLHRYQCRLPDLQDRVAAIERSRAGIMAILTPCRDRLRRVRDAFAELCRGAREPVDGPGWCACAVHGPAHTVRAAARGAAGAAPGVAAEFRAVRGIVEALAENREELARMRTHARELEDEIPANEAEAAMLRDPAYLPAQVRRTRPRRPHPRPAPRRGVETVIAN
jgi:hypothetical protein